MRRVVIILALIGAPAMAKTAKAKTEAKYLNSGGQELAVTDALLASIKGETVYKCTVVESQVSKSGTSIALKTKKK